MNIPIIYENSKVPVFLSKFSPITIGAIVIWPFIFFKHNITPVILNHEKIHIKQYGELLVIGFWILYAYDYIKGLIKYRNNYKDHGTLGSKSYYRLRSEQEAYENQYDLEYLSKRKPYEWLTKYKV